MDQFFLEIFKEINKMVNYQENIYCDLDIKFNGGVLQSTSKVVVYLLHPYLLSSLSAADCIILTETEVLDRQLVEEGNFVESSETEEPFHFMNDGEEQSELIVPETVQANNMSPKICEFCCSHFGTEKALTKHIRERHTYTFSCQDCHAMFGNKSDLRKHQVRHNKESFHECPVCGIRIKHKKNLSRHLLIHDS